MGKSLVFVRLGGSDGVPVLLRSTHQLRGVPAGSSLLGPGWNASPSTAAERRCSASCCALTFSSSLLLLGKIRLFESVSSVSLGDVLRDPSWDVEVTRLEKPSAFPELRCPSQSTLVVGLLKVEGTWGLGWEST